MNHRLAPLGRAAGIACLSAAALALAACGTAPNSLRPMASPASLQLQSPVKWALSRHFHDFHDTLIAGTYVAVGESDEGTYFVGPQPCLVEANEMKDKTPSWGGIARDCGIFKPKKASVQPTVFFVQNGFWMATDFTADGTPNLDKLTDHRDLGGQPDAAPKRSVLDPTAATMPVATTAAAAGGRGPITAGVGNAIGTSLVAGFIAADLGTYHDVDTQPPAGWLEAALAPRPTN